MNIGLINVGRWSQYVVSPLSYTAPSIIIIVVVVVVFLPSNDFTFTKNTRLTDYITCDLVWTTLIIIDTRPEH